MQQWEYLTLEYRHTNTGTIILINVVAEEKQSIPLYRRLTDLGREGWELVMAHESGHDVQFIFKRPLQTA